METEDEPLNDDLEPTPEQVLYRFLQDNEGKGWVIVDRKGMQPFTVAREFATDDASPLTFAWFDTRADAQMVITMLELGDRVIPMKLYRNSRRLAP